VTRNVAIMIFDDAEVLDFAGPFEVFAVTRDINDHDTHLFNVYTVAQTAKLVSARNGLLVQPNYTLATCPPPDIILIPGGQGARAAMHNERILDWVQAQARRVEQVLSVCTGAFILARAGLLKDLAATTYHTVFDTLAELEPTVTLHRDRRFVDNGHVVTSAGISAGIDMALHIIAKLHGVEQARFTAELMEYSWDESDTVALLAD
jgi:transcriptional regulator GlxA family with amidase domain